MELARSLARKLANTQAVTALAPIFGAPFHALMKVVKPLWTSGVPIPIRMSLPKLARFLAKRQLSHSCYLASVQKLPHSTSKRSMEVPTTTKRHWSWNFAQMYLSMHTSFSAPSSTRPYLLHLGDCDSSCRDNSTRLKLFVWYMYGWGKQKYRSA